MFTESPVFTGLFLLQIHLFQRFFRLVQSSIMHLKIGRKRFIIIFIREPYGPLLKYA